MTPEEELYAKFYNHEQILVKDMDIIQLREHRNELSKVAFEAKARLVAADDKIRNLTGKVKARDWLTTIEGDQAASDAINVVKARKKRMSSMDKMKDRMLTAGLDEATVNEIIKGLEKTATESSINKVDLSGLKTVVFTVEETKTSNEIKAIQVEENSEDKLFDPTAIKFG